MVHRLRLIASALLLIAIAAVAQAQSFPPFAGRVVDAAHLLTPAQAQGEAARAATYKYWIAINDDPDKMEETLNQYGAGGWRAAGFCVLPLDGFRQSQMLVLFEKSAD